MPPIFLAYRHPTGETKYAPLVTANEPIFYLPAGVEDEIDLAVERPPVRYDVAQIELISSMPFLSAYGREICRLFVDGQEISIPASTDNAVKYVLLRDGDQFETSAGRWSVERDDEQGTITTIHNSMRPPPLPEVPVQDKLELLRVPRDKDRVSIEIPPLPTELDDSFVEDVPYSDDPPLDDKREAPLLTSNHNETTAEIDLRRISTQDSSREMLNNALNGIVDSSYERSESTDETTEDIHQTSAGLTHNAASGSGTVKKEVVKAILEDTAHSRGKRKAVSGERTYKRKKTFNQRMIDQQQIEETVIVATAPNPSEESPQSSTKDIPALVKETRKRQNRRDKLDPPPLTPEPEATLEATRPSPIIGSGRSTRSHRSESQADCSSSSYAGSPIVYFASNTKIDRKCMSAFESLGGMRTESIEEANMLCVGAELKKTEALLLAILRGIEIVTEAWLVEASRNKRFPDPSKYLPQDEKHEREWGFRLVDAMQHGRQSQTKVLEGKKVFITAHFKSERGNTCFQSIKNIAKALGAEVKLLPKSGKKAITEAFAIGLANDTEACQVGRLGMKLYDKEVLTSAILRGQLDLDSSEYAVAIPVKEEDKD